MVIVRLQLLNPDNPVIQLAVNFLGCDRGIFPCSYVGMPLFASKLKRSDFQPTIDKVTKKLAGW